MYDTNFSNWKNKKGKSKEDKMDKTAIFRIQPDGEIFIIKKADEDFPKETKSAPSATALPMQMQEIPTITKSQSETKNSSTINSVQAKIETIYDRDESAKIREDQTLKKFNKVLTNTRKWQSLC